MPRNPAVVLVGPMAVGKSAVGRMLAERIDTRFIDTDRLIVEQHGSIAGIFARQGEEAFRAIEADVVRAAVLDGIASAEPVDPWPSYPWPAHPS